MVGKEQTTVRDEPAPTEGAPTYDDMITRMRCTHLTRATNPSPADDPTTTSPEIDRHQEHKRQVRIRLII